MTVSTDQLLKLLQQAYLEGFADGTEHQRLQAPTIPTSAQVIADALRQFQVSFVRNCSAPQLLGMEVPA